MDLLYALGRGATMRISLVAILLALVAVGCTPREKSAKGFRLPEGDPVEGQEVFLRMKCPACHAIRLEGVELPPPVADPPVPVRLGGVVHYQPTDGEFVTSIINPSHRIAPDLPQELVRSGGASRMADYSDLMTVRELVDLVAFLHTRYEFSPPVR
jgi:L-cysteine S-thiosulfotransferase